MENIVKVMENIKSIKEIDFTFEKYIELLNLYSNIDEKIKLNYERFNIVLYNIKSNSCTPAM